MGRAPQCYTQDLSSYVVQCEERDGSTYLIGLPLMRPGIWNGTAYTPEMLQQIASNFAQVRDGEGSEPALKLRHGWDSEGHALQFRATEVMAWFSDVRWDAENQVLVGDVRSVDDALEAGVRSGKLRYLSTEILDGYRIADRVTGQPGDPIGMVLVGCAWVDRPAVTGLGIAAVTERTDGVAGNALRDDARAETRQPESRLHINGATRDEPAQRGAVSMSVWERVKTALLKAGCSEQDVAGIGEEEATPPAAPAPQTNQQAGPEVTALQATIDGQTATIATLQQQVATLRDDNRRQAITARVDGMVAAGKVAPAEKDGVIALAMSLPADGTVQVFAADGTAGTMSQVEAYLSTMERRTPQVNSAGTGVVWTGSEDPEHVEPLSAEQIEALVKHATG